MHQNYFGNAAGQEGHVQYPHPDEVTLSHLESASRERALGVATTDAQFEESFGCEKGEQNQIRSYH